MTSVLYIELRDIHLPQRRASSSEYQSRCRELHSGVRTIGNSSTRQPGPGVSEPWKDLTRTTQDGEFLSPHEYPRFWIHPPRMPALQPVPDRHLTEITSTAAKLWAAPVNSPHSASPASPCLVPVSRFSLPRDLQLSRSCRFTTSMKIQSIAVPISMSVDEIHVPMPGTRIPVGPRIDGPDLSESDQGFPSPRL